MQPENTQPTGVLAGFPLPADLAGRLPERETSAYLPEDLICHGREYASSLGYSNVAASDDSLFFSPAYTGAMGQGLDDTAYAIYYFVADGYDREYMLNYRFDGPPDDWNKLYLGLGNFDDNKWEWYGCDAGGCLPELDTKHFSNSGEVLAAFVAVGTSDSSLRYVRLGESVISARFSVSPKGGVAPVESNITGASSTVEVGTIVNYSWDFDGNRTYERDTGSTPTTTETYNAGGVYSIGLRVTGSYGEQDTASTTFAVSPPWTRSWGEAKDEEFTCVAADPPDYLYFAGTRKVGTDNTDVLIACVSYLGEIQWIRSWGGPANETVDDITVGSDGNVVLVGSTESFGAGHSDALAQQWSPTGDLLWTTTWGMEWDDYGHGVDASSGDYYVVGSLWKTWDDTQCLLLKLNSDGNLVWARHWGGQADDVAYAVDAVKLLFTENVRVHVTGTLPSHDPVWRDHPFHAVLTGDGDQVGSISVLAVNTRSVGTAIRTSATLNAEVFIGGTFEAGSIKHAMLINDKNGTGAVRKIWRYGDAEHSFTDMLASGGSYILVGHTTGGGGDEIGLILRLSSDGTFEGAMLGQDSNTDCLLYQLVPFGSQGLVLAGAWGAGIDVSWSSTSGTISEGWGDWTDEGDTVQTPAGSTGHPGGTVHDHTGDGVQNSGGGGMDAGFAAIIGP